MASVKYLVRNTSTKKETPISLIVYLPNRKRLRYSTDIKIKPIYWSDKTQKVKLNLDTSKYRDIVNLRLSEIRNFIDTSTTELKVKNKLNPNNLKYMLDVFFGKINKSGKENLNFYEYVDKFIEQSENRVGKSTICTYKRTLILIKEFEKKHRYKIDFETINMGFYNKYTNFLTDLNQNENTKGKQIKNIKTFMNNAFDDKYTSENGHTHKNFKVTKNKSFNIYLNIDELDAIEKVEYDLDCTNDIVRDWFLIGCWTGQRVSDWKKLNNDNIIENDGIKSFKITQSKTNEEVVIPIHNRIKKILKKRNGNFPKLISEQKINKHIKDIVFEAEIIQPIPQKENTPKNKLVATHTARRSFCTNAYKKGLDSLAIMQLSGHKTEKNFLTYIKIEKEEFANRIANHAFFKE